MISTKVRCFNEMLYLRFICRSPSSGQHAQFKSVQSTKCFINNHRFHRKVYHFQQSSCNFRVNLYFVLCQPPLFFLQRQLNGLSKKTRLIASLSLVTFCPNNEHTGDFSWPYRCLAQEHSDK